MVALGTLGLWFWLVQNDVCKPIQWKFKKEVLKFGENGNLVKYFKERITVSLLENLNE